MQEASGYIPSFKESADTEYTDGNDTGISFMGNRPRSFDYVNTVMSVVPTGVTDSSRDYMAPLILAIIILALSVAGFRRTERVFLLLRFFKLRLRKQRHLCLEDLPGAIERDRDSVS